MKDFRGKYYLWIGSFIVFIYAFFTCSSQAASVQNFSDLNFANPAAIITTKEFRAILGGYYVNGDVKFKGTSAGMTGEVLTHPKILIPHGLIAVRVHPRVVVGFEISEPFLTESDYGITPANIVRFAAVKTRQRSYDFKPTLAVQVTKKLAVAVASDMMYTDATLTQYVAPGVLFTEAGDTTAFGWHAGLLYRAFKGTIFGLSYFSQLTPLYQGYTSLTNVNTGAPITGRIYGASASLPLPATVIGSVTQYFSEATLVRLAVAHSSWSRFDVLDHRNTVLGNFVTPFFYDDTWRTEISGLHEFNDIVEIKGFFAYDTNPVKPIFRSPSLPADKKILLGIGLGINLNKIWKVDLGFGLSHHVGGGRINLTGPTGIRTVGRGLVTVPGFAFAISANV